MSFIDDYTRGLKSADVHRLFTRDTAEAYHYFTRHLDDELASIGRKPWYRRWFAHTRLLFRAFTMRLSPARRVLYGFSVVAVVLGLLELFRGFGTIPLLIFPFTIRILVPSWTEGTMSMLIGFLAINLLILMEVADRLSLKGDLEIARDIQLAMLPGGMVHAGDTTIAGVTRPANTVGGDFYDVILRPDGKIVIALGDVAGKGSPAALLMALVVAMLRTLVDENLDPATLMERLNVQVSRHSPASRFITLFYGVYDPADGGLEYVNAGHLPPIVRRRTGQFERVAEGGGLALGMFDHATYQPQRGVVGAGDIFVLYSDGVTEAENRAGRPFEDTGLEAVVASEMSADPQAIGRAILAAVDVHAGDVRLADDVTALVLKR
jgi:serine phosphatase RsbU (regulator of sigma subunit)